MRAARDLILVICAVISTVCLVYLVHIAIKLEITPVETSTSAIAEPRFPAASRASVPPRLPSWVPL